MKLSQLTLHERLFIYAIIISLLILSSFRVLLSIVPINLSESNFLFFHTLLESFSIFVSFSIFIQAVITYSPERKNPHLFIGLIFFVVGSFDLLHTFLYKGMPFMNDHFAVARATWFWISARLIESIGVGLAFYLPYRFIIKNRSLSITLSSIFVCIVSLIIIFIPDQLPILIHETSGMTTLKISFEYFICLILFLTIIVLGKQYLHERNKDMLRLITSVFFIMISELFFTLYTRVFDIENMIGHVYKFAGYLFLYRAIFFPQIKQIMSDRELAESKWKEAENKWKETEETLYEVEKELTQQIFQVHERDMKRVSRELHDGIGQSLYSILITLNIAATEPCMEKRNEIIQKLKLMTSDAMKEVKGIAHSLRPSALDDLGFVPALKSFVADYEHTHKIKVLLEIYGDKNRFETNIETALYRICQEALSNAAKYSQADSIHIIIVNGLDDISLSIEDNGIGFSLDEYKINNSQKRGIGLYSMNERAEGLGGSFQIISKFNSGTLIRIHIPKTVQSQAIAH